MTKESIVIIDYGSGNLRSASKAFEKVATDENLPLDIIVSANPEDLNKASRIVLPGQGAFADCMAGLTKIPGMIESLEQNVLKKAKPFLGICVGMQLMATRGLEYGEHKGLNWIPGDVIKITPADKTLKIPHMGWNEIAVTQPSHFSLRSIETSEHFYFVHSFMVECKDKAHVLAQTNYGGPITAAIGRDNMIGVQFHPEKSQKAGVTLISDFLKWRV